MYTNIYTTCFGFFRKSFNLFCPFRETRSMQIKMSPTLKYIPDMNQVEIARIGIIQRIIQRVSLIQHISRILILPLFNPLPIYHRMWQSLTHFDFTNNIDRFRRGRGKQGDGTSYEILIQSSHRLLSTAIVNHLFIAPVASEKLNIATIRTFHCGISSPLTHIFRHISLFVYIDVRNLLSNFIIQLIR